MPYKISCGKKSHHIKRRGVKRSPGRCLCDYYAIKYSGHRPHLRENEHLFRC